MQLKRFLLRVLAVSALALCGIAHAQTHQLSVRPTGGGEFEAVITYDTHLCNVQVTPPASIERSGNAFQITSPERPPGACLGPIPPLFVEEVAPLGVLAPGEYTVSWSQPGMFQLSTQYVVYPSSVGSSVEIPAIGLIGGLVLIVGILLSLRLTTH